MSRALSICAILYCLACGATCGTACGQTFAPTVSYGSGGRFAWGLTLADVNGDGKLDIVTTNANGGTVGVLLGNGDGTFQSVMTFNAGGVSPDSVAVTDVNGDGKPDIVVAAGDPGCCRAGTVGVLLGNGDGTFQPVVTYGSGGLSDNSVAIADVNGDGKPDIVVVNWCATLEGGLCVGDGVIGVLLGNGDGTFQPAVTYDAGGVQSFSLAVADVNGDGRPDIVVANQCANYLDFNCNGNGTVGVLLGNGDGTFQPVVANDSGGQDAYSVAVADVNGDGKLDIVVGNVGGPTTVGVLLGNGDGTFKAAAGYGSGWYATGVAVADVNGDGKPDIVVADEDIAVGVLLGNGDGTFQSTMTFSSGGYNSYSVAVADVNGDGKPDIMVANSCTADVSGSCAGNGIMGVLINTSLPATTSALVSSQNPSSFGQAVTFTATVNPYSGTGTLTGTVTFTNGGATLCNALTLTGRVATCIYSNLPTGADTVTASYSGDSNFAPSSGTINQTVNIASTTTTVVSSLNPSTFDQQVSFTATITGEFGGSPSGTVTFTYGSTTLCNAVTVSGGTATCAYSALPVASAIVTATYSGDSNFTGSSASVNQKVSQASTTLALVSGTQPSPFGQPVTFTATITPQYGGQTSGTVSFSDGSTSLGSVAVSGNTASLTTSNISLGTQSIKAAYSGDSNFISSSASLNQTVNQASTKLTLTSSINPSALGQAVMLTAVVTPAYNGTPTGTVAFYDGTTSLGNVALSLGTTDLVISTLSTGSHSLTASYGGDTDFQPSTSPVVTQVVKEGAATVTLLSSPDPSYVDQAVMFTATVAGVNGLVPTGSVKFQQGSVVLSTVPLSSGTAIYSTTYDSSGNRSITAVYSGDINYPTKTSKVLKQVVDKYTSDATTTSSLNPAVYGQAVNLISQVTSAAPSKPTGTVTFKNGPTSLGTAPLVNGTALLTKKNLPAGTLSITATYSSDAVNNKTTSPTLSQVVSQATTTTTVTSTPNPSVAGNNVKFTATIKSPTTVAIGTVTFTTPTTTLGTISVAGGKASLTTSALPAGTTTVTATYNGTSNIEGSSGSVAQTVN